MTTPLHSDDDADDDLLSSVVPLQPCIDDLDDALVIDSSTGSVGLLLSEGDKIVIERLASCLPGRPWLDTKTYLIRRVDRTTGDLDLLDLDLEQSAGSNFVSGHALGYRFKRAST